LNYYWSNVRSTHTTTTETIKFKCSPDECKLWKPEDESVMNECKECWIETDLEDYVNWDGRGSFNLQEIYGRDKEQPFELDSTTKTCALQCKDGFWSNHDSTYNKAAFGADQRCSWANCKNWDYSGSSRVSPNLCTDITITEALAGLADTIAEKLCPKVPGENLVPETQPNAKVTLRFGQYEFADVANSSDKAHYLTIHYIGRGNFIMMNRNFVEIT